MPRSKFQGTIIAIRAVEDSIRATKKYTEGIGTMLAHHPIQGGDFTSKRFNKYYEVYPEIDLDQMRSFWDAAYTTSDWLWGETPRIDVVFNYDYRNGLASMTVKDGAEAVKELAKAIPGFSDALARALAGENDKAPAPAVSLPDRDRISPVAHP